MTLLQLGTATCGPNGTVTASFTLPSQVTDDYQVIAAGIATLPTDKDVPYSVLATVTQDANGPISVTAPGCRPGTQVRFSVRYREAASPAPAAAASGLPRTGTDIVSTVLIGLTALSIGAALVVTAVNHRRRTRSA